MNVHYFSFAVNFCFFLNRFNHRKYALIARWRVQAIHQDFTQANPKLTPECITVEVVLSALDSSIVPLKLY